ncbi:amidohydrolase family protein [Gracilimonas mengyeensis]|uniref:Amidohydrolase n=1 Tax=Gracilimonas mengyeensis TaxID=1302730 RepID=A0A521BV31_9BACT|nr:amidohydrolase family protein [Gracilimonas mengyeensis]SMO50935.1 Amidohydrolase [Gracilimonas mengyeensis]
MKNLRLFYFIVAVLLLSGNTTLAQEPDTTMSFEEYDPESTLVVPGEVIKSAKYPFVDVHSHLWRMSEMDLSVTAKEMDSLNMKVLVNLSGRSGERLKQMVEAAEAQAPGRFIVFANLDFDGIDDPDWTERTVQQLQEDYENGARGLKIFKNLGLTVTDSEGNRLHTDDPRLDPVWAKAGELGIPVLIHTGEPEVFWAPINEKNERWLEMKNFPNRHRGDSTRYPSWEVVMQEQWNVFRKHPETTFINAHLGWMGNDLARLGDLLDEFPNVYTEISAAVAEIGRQPRFAHDFFVKYQDRILFGKDTYRPKEYWVYFRVLESDDEYFDYFRKRHAFWKMYGLNLPDEVLEKVYYKNALKVVPGIDASLFTTN